MTEVIGDVLIPKELVVPEDTGRTATLNMSGANLYVSGNKLWFYDGVAQRLVTSS